MVSSEEALPVSIVIDGVIPGGGEQGQVICMIQVPDVTGETPSAKLCLGHPVCPSPCPHLPLWFQHYLLLQKLLD